MATLSLLVLGLAQYTNNKGADAIETFTKAISQPDGYIYPEIYFFRSLTYLDANKYELALKDLDQAISLDPNYADAYSGRAYLYFRADGGRVDRAVKELSKAISLDDTNATYYHNRGVFYLETERGELGLSDLSKAIELASDDAGYYKDRGMAYYQAGDYDNALKDLDYALQLFNENRQNYRDKIMLEEMARTHVYYGTIQTIFRSYYEALIHFNKAIQLKPDYANAYYLRAGLYSEMNNAAKAKDDLVSALSLGLDEKRKQQALNVFHAIENGIPFEFSIDN